MISLSLVPIWYLEDPHATIDFSILQRMEKAEEIANVVYFLLPSDSSFITGQIFTVDDGLHYSKL